MAKDFVLRAAPVATHGQNSGDQEESDNQCCPSVRNFRKQTADPEIKCRSCNRGKHKSPCSLDLFGSSAGQKGCRAATKKWIPCCNMLIPRHLMDVSAALISPSASRCFLRVRGRKPGSQNAMNGSLRGRVCCTNGWLRNSIMGIAARKRLVISDRIRGELTTPPSRVLSRNHCL